jgi:hypothetical protein
MTAGGNQKTRTWKMCDRGTDMTPESLVRKIFELDAQYQGSIIKAKSREDFLKTQIESLVSDALEESSEALKQVTVSLIAAVSLLESGGRKAAPSNKMFTMMISDYKKAIEQGRKVLWGAMP